VCVCGWISTWNFHPGRSERESQYPRSRYRSFGTCTKPFATAVAPASLIPLKLPSSLGLLYGHSHSHTSFHSANMTPTCRQNQAGMLKIIDQDSDWTKSSTPPPVPLPPSLPLTDPLSVTPRRLSPSRPSYQPSLRHLCSSPSLAHHPTPHHSTPILTSPLPPSSSRPLPCLRPYFYPCLVRIPHPCP
jgi:hypothetical protein